MLKRVTWAVIAVIACAWSWFLFWIAQFVVRGGM